MFTNKNNQILSLQVQSTQFIGKALHTFAEITSTNEYAKQCIAKNEPLHGTVILADYQSKGRGQASNRWQSAAGKNILASIIFRPKLVNVNEQFIMNKFISVAIAETVEKLCNEKVAIKWPNDILIDGQKLCGLLIENILRKQNIEYSIVGIGLNVNQVAFAEQPNATSLKLVLGTDVDRMDFLEQLFLRIEFWIDEFNQTKFGNIKRAYFSRLYQYQEKANYKVKDDVVRGEIMGVTNQGQLQVLINNKIELFANKEIVFL